MDAITETIAGIVLVAATAVWERTQTDRWTGPGDHSPRVMSGRSLWQFHRAGMEAPWLPLWMIHGRNEPRATRHRS